MDRKLADALERNADLAKTPFIQNDITERILEKTGGEGLYHKFEFDLSEARTDEEYEFSGDRLTVEDVDDAVTIKLNSKKNSPVDLQKIPEIHGAIKRFFVTNAAGSGTLKLLAGSKGMFEFKKKLEFLASPDYIFSIEGSHFVATDGLTGRTFKRNTDASTVIQAARDKIASMGIFFFKPGSYPIHTKVSDIDGKVTYQGSGGGTYHSSSGATIFTRDANITMLEIAGVSGAHIRKPQIRDIAFSSTRGTYTTDALKFSYATYPSIHRCSFTSIEGAALLFYKEVYGSLISECNFNACGKAGTGTIHYRDDCTFGCVDHSIFENDYVCGILSDINSVGVRITDNYMEATSSRPSLGHIYGKFIGGHIAGNQLSQADRTSYGIYLDGTKNKILGNTIIRAETGIKAVQDGQNIVGNNIYDSGGDGILAYHNSIIEANIIDTAGDDGIVCTDYNVVTGNTIYNVTDDALYVQGMDNIITGNKMKTCDVGLRIKAGETDNICNSNHCFASTTADFVDGGTRTTINGTGLNAGNPGAAGDWNGHGYEGLIVRDTTGGATYLYINGGWVSI